MREIFLLSKSREVMFKNMCLHNSKIILIVINSGIRLLNVRSPFLKILI